MRRAAGFIPRGFTLVEVLSVLVVIAVIAVMAWPVMQKPFANRRLHTAADVVRTEFCHARVQAMRSGQTHSFRYAVEGNRYCTAPRQIGAVVPAAALETPALPVIGDADGGTIAAEVPRPSVERTLPEGVKFLAGELAADAAVDPVAPETESLADLSDCWSDPILFYPDGTTSDARLLMANEHGFVVELMLRGLTGTVSVGDLMSASD